MASSRRSVAGATRSASSRFLGVCPDPLFGDLIAPQPGEASRQVVHVAARIGPVALESVVLEQEVSHLLERDPLRGLDVPAARGFVDATPEECDCFIVVGGARALALRLAVEVELDGPVARASAPVERPLADGWHDRTPGAGLSVASEGGGTAVALAVLAGF